VQVRDEIVDFYLPSYLKSTTLINQELCKMLSYLQVSDIISPTLQKMETDTTTTDLKSIYLSGEVSARSDQYGKDVEKMLANMPNKQNISYAKSLSVIREGWTDSQRTRYFRWYNKALNRSGGLMYSQFIRKIQLAALQNVPESERQFYEALGEDLEQSGNYMINLVQPKGPGKNWTVEGVAAAYNAKLTSVNFENGENMFRSSLCASCHSVNGKGGNSGPELTKIGTRFTINDLAEAIVNPSNSISDRYRNTKYILEDNEVIIGRLINETEEELEVSVNSFTPNVTTKFRKDRLLRAEESGNSPMPPSLINRLNEQELADLIAYLLGGGNATDKIYQQ
jgi:putative heme-binding domain-containing protein